MGDFEILRAQLQRHRQRGAVTLRKALADMKGMARRAVQRTPKTPESTIAKALADPRIQARLTLAKAHECLDADIKAGVPAATIAERERRLNRVAADLRARGML